MTYDYIFCGFGLSTMLLLEELAFQNILDGKNILIIEKSDSADKSWCFWEKGMGKWDDLLRGSWDYGTFKSDATNKEILNGYTYKCISAVTLSDHLRQILKRYSCVFKHEVVSDFKDDCDLVTVITDKQTYCGRFLFNSVYDPSKDAFKSKLLLQHFEGHYIECASPGFKANEATIMDFTVAQQGNTRFMYVLPFTETSALIEYTLFSPTTLPKSAYTEAIEKYLRDRKITDYTITKTESGIIPMTGHPFWKKNTKNVLHIGTSGGWTKASSGYTFDRALKMSQKVAMALKKDNVDFRKFHKTTRFEWYDKLFIEVLFNDNAIGKKLFASLFINTRSDLVMRFLKEETTLSEDLSIMLSCPKRPFLKALLGLK